MTLKERQYTMGFTDKETSVQTSNILGEFTKLVPGFYKLFCSSLCYVLLTSLCLY